MKLLEVLFLDKDIIVVHKPAGISSQAERGSSMDMVCMIKNYLAQKGIKYEDVYVLHRLDKPVAGVLVYALNKKAAAGLSEDIKNRKVLKKYYALLSSLPQGLSDADFNKEFELKDIITKAEMKNTYKLVKENEMNKLNESEKKEAKEAILKYKILDKIEFEGNSLYLADIELITGRYHQIRLQFNSADAPLFGDIKYNQQAKDNGERRGVALCSYRLEFSHPITKEMMRFEIKPTNSIFSI